MLGRSLVQVLVSIGLKEIMTDNESQPAFDRSQFLVYTPPEYLLSEHQDRDAVHRITEGVLLHKATGLRIKCLVSESYYGDELRYRVAELFVITKEGERLVIRDWDETSGNFITNKGIATSESLSRETPL